MDPRTPADRIEELLAHRQWVRRVARALVLDESRADDLEQETWVRALNRPPPRPARAWLGTVLRNAASDMRRGEARRAAHEGAAPPPRSVPPPEALLERAEIVEQVAKAVRTLEEPYRAAILLRYFEDLSPPAIAAHLGVPLETVRTRLRRALALLRERLDREHRGDRRAWTLLLLPLVRRPSPAAAGAAVSAGVLGAILMTLKAKALVAAGLVLLLGGWFLLGRVGAGPARERPRTASLPAESPAIPTGKRSAPPGVAPAEAPTAPSPAREGAAIASPIPSDQKEAKALRVFCGFEGAKVAARFHVCGGDPDPEPVTGTTDSTGAVLLTVPPHPNLLDAFEVMGRAAGYATTVVRLEEFPKTKSVTLQMQRGWQPVSGRVVDELGLPVPGAHVRGALEEVETGEDGSFEAFWTPPTAWFKVEHPDFLPWLATEMIPVPSSGVEVRLSRGLSVSGRVSFEDGRPAAGARVEVDAGPGQGGRSRTATADAEGAYAVSGLPPGRVTVRCIAGGEMFGLAPDERKSVEAGAGGVDFVLKGRLVRVRVLDEAGHPFRNAELICRWFRDEYGEWNGSRVLCGEGESALEVPLGVRLTVAVRFRGYATGMAEVAAEDAPGERDVLIRMRRLGPPGRIEIVARDPAGRPLRKVRVTLSTIAGLPLLWFGGSRDFEPDARGVVAIEGVPAQQIQAEIAGPLDPASETDFLVPWRKSFLMKDGGSERWEVALQQGGRLRVRVEGQDGNPLRTFTLRLKDAGGNVRHERFYARNEHGWGSPPLAGDAVYLLEPIPAGSYRVEVLRSPVGDGVVIGTAPVEVVAGRVVDVVVRTEK